MIDYDGYVNTQNHTGMKDFLGNVVEICQTVTMQKNNSALINYNRVPGDILVEARQAQLLVPASLSGVVVVIIVVVIVALSIDWVEGNETVRGNEVEFHIEHWH